ncbi:MAG: methyltransferase domain-containing protein [Pseudomonadota bacterium]|nr:methyltransferase domain-containing protein [Pseudomonadota bacterium]MBU1150860.1 methyltransferase domain-containing protein [Pseudomonadota bacterium]MBU4121701.1 methyltransferase domain-containing protein [Pseudomonadota bacterium]
MNHQIDSNLTAQTKTRYNRIAPYYDVMEIISERTFSRWRRQLLARAKGKVLEVGVGTGKNFPYYPEGVDVTGLDIADKMLLHARLRADKLGFPVHLMEGDVQSLPFPENYFDTAVTTFVFCSVPDPVLGLKELGRVVRSDGEILLLEHVRIDRPVIGFIMDIMNPFFLHFIGPNINRRTVENVGKAGLRIEKIEHLGFMQMVKMIVAHPGK